MFKRILLSLAVASSLLYGAETLVLNKGEVMAHTEVFGDKTIDPKTEELRVNLTKDGGVDSIRGEISFDALSLVSDNKDRDKDMYKKLNAETYKDIKADIKNIIFGESKYIITADITLNGVTKEVKALSDIVEKDGDINLKGKFYIKMTDFGVKPPVLLFVKVRDQVDITFDISLKE